MENTPATFTWLTRLRRTRMSTRLWLKSKRFFIFCITYYLFFRRILMVYKSLGSWKVDWQYRWNKLVRAPRRIPQGLEVKLKVLIFSQLIKCNAIWFFLRHPRKVCSERKLRDVWSSSPIPLWPRWSRTRRRRRTSVVCRITRMTNVFATNPVQMIFYGSFGFFMW